MDNLTINMKAKMYSTLPELIAKKIVMWDFHVDDSAKGRYAMILGRDLLK